MSYSIDASVFVAAARDQEAHHEASLEFLTQLANRFADVYCPTLLLVECIAAVARRTNDQLQVQEIAATIDTYPGLHFVPLTRGRARRAAELAAEHRLRG